MEEPKDLLTDELEITGELRNHLSGTAKWAKFLSVIGLVFCAGMLVFAFYAAFYVSPLMRTRYGFSLGPAISAIYIFLAAVLFFPCVLLYKFSVKLLDAIKENARENIESAFLNLRSMFKFIAIVVIIVLTLWFMSLIFTVVRKFH